MNILINNILHTYSKRCLHNMLRLPRNSGMLMLRGNITVRRRGIFNRIGSIEWWGVRERVACAQTVSCTS